MGIFKFKKETKENEVKAEKKTAPFKVEKKFPAVTAPKAEPAPEKEKVNQDKKLVTGILIEPLITEKATNLAQLNQYVFAVKVGANKIQIAHAIFSRYGVKPIKINIVKNLGKTVRYGRSVGKTKNKKKAIVILPEGKTIKIHEGT